MTQQNPARTANVSAPASRQLARRTAGPYQRFDGDLAVVMERVGKRIRPALDQLAAYDRKAAEQASRQPK